MSAQNKELDRISLKFFKKALIVLIFVFALLPKTSKAQEASFYLSPSKGSYNLDQIFQVDILIDTKESSINAAEGKIYFPKEILKVVNISKQDSIFLLWTKEPTFLNSQGVISFGGGLPNPGFSGLGGKIITIYFQGISLGKAQVVFGQEAILANDALGTDIFSKSLEGIYFIGISENSQTSETLQELLKCPRIFSSTHPFQNNWFNNNNPKFYWSLPQDITGVSILLDQNPISDPGNNSQGVFNSKTFKGIPDGIWYFHLKLQNDFGWGKICNYKIQIDTVPPVPFEITIDNGGDSTNPQPILHFKAKDSISGISHYEIRIGEGDVFTLAKVQSNPFQLPFQNPGIHNIEVRAVDIANNKTLAVLELKIDPISAPQISVCPATFLSGEETLYVEGAALANAKVIVFFEKDKSLVKKWEVPVDENGNWNLKQKGLFRSGIYAISARTQDAKGAISNPSQQCVIKVTLKGLAIGSWILSHNLLNTILSLAFAVLLVIFIYFILRIKRIKNLIDLETQDFKNKFYKEYNELKVGIEKQLVTFKELKGKDPLSQKEQEREKELIKDLNDVERVLIKELKDIENIK